MRKTNQVSREIGHLLLALSKKVTGRSIVKNVFDAKGLARQKMMRVLESEGVTRYEILKVRADGRCVAKADHPRHGTVVVKSYMPNRDQYKAHANLYLSRMVQESGGDLFPKIYRAELGYTVEEWVEGISVADVKRLEMEAAPIQDVLERIKTWSLAHAPGGTMWPEDVQDTTIKYVNKTFGRLKYGSNAAIIRKTRRFYRHRERLTGLLDRLQAQAGAVRLPLCLALVDIGPGNLMRHDASGPLCVIDYEQAMYAHYGFDSVFVLHSLFRRKVPAATISALEAYVFSVEHLGSEEAVRFFFALYSALNEISNVA